MSVTNVATIMAPNLFQPQRAHNRMRRLSFSAEKSQAITDEMVWTNETPKLMGILIKYRELIWTVPLQLISQLRAEYNFEANKQKNNTSNSQFRQLIWRKSRVDSIKEINVEVTNEEMDFLNITMPQFTEAVYKMNISADTTVKDVLVKVLKSRNVEDAVNMSNPLPLDSHSNSSNGISYTAVEATTTVTTSGAKNPKLTNQTSTSKLCTRRPSLQNAIIHHALHECGGNIGERLLDPHATIKAIYQENPSATFVVKCHHCDNDENVIDLISTIDTCTLNNSSQDDSDTGSESILLYPSNWNSCIQILISLPIYPTACALFVIFAAFYSIISEYEEHN
ncbi:unnamed protein product [Meganyctiphanes norvegica]|uniref:RHG40/28/18 C-terminal ubiquitin-like domain-containing protein n=1 Tax=Meganyctiphanes norvegica TaxID=48144 RepID=A0AAV2RNF9_MEGNR